MMMTWRKVIDIWVNLDRFVFYGVSADGEGTLITPGGSTLYLSEEHRWQLDCLWRGRAKLDHTVPGLTYPENSTATWIKVTGGAINMALIELVETGEEGTITVRAGKHSRTYEGADNDLIRRWLLWYDLERRQNE
jgi:hypothetical protein